VRALGCALECTAARASVVRVEGEAFSLSRWVKHRVPGDRGVVRRAAMPGMLRPYSFTGPFRLQNRYLLDSGRFSLTVRQQDLVPQLRGRGRGQLVTPEAMDAALLIHPGVSRDVAPRLQPACFHQVG